MGCGEHDEGAVAGEDVGDETFMRVLGWSVGIKAGYRGSRTHEVGRLGFCALHGLKTQLKAVMRWWLWEMVVSWRSEVEDGGEAQV